MNGSMKTGTFERAYYGYRLATFFTSFVPYFVTKINRANGFNEPEVLALAVCVISFIMFSLSFIKGWFSLKIKEYGLFAWAVLMSTFNGVLLYLNGSPEIHLYPILVLLIVAGTLHQTVLGLLFSTCMVWCIGTTMTVLGSFPVETSKIFFLIGETFLFVVLVLGRWENIRNQQIISENIKLLERQTTELAFINKEQDQFNYVLSHDLKKPLESINMLVSFSLKDWERQGIKLPDDVVETFTTISGRVDQLKNLIKGVLDYSRAGEQKEKNWLSVRSEIDNVLEMIHVPKHFTITVTGPHVKLYFNQVEFRQILQNIITNAIKYNDKDRGKLDIEINKKPGEITLNFKDYGVGIEKQNIEKVFDFLETLRYGNDYENTGIGLSIVKRSVEKNGGAVSLTSHPGKWTNFHIKLLN